MKTVKKGRPPRKEKRHVIWLTTSTLRLWNERRKAFGLKNKSNSEFAEVLLHGMFLKRTGRFDCPDNNNNKGAQRTLVVGGPLTTMNVCAIFSIIRDSPGSLLHERHAERSLW